MRTNRFACQPFLSSLFSPHSPISPSIIVFDTIRSPDLLSQFVYFVHFSRKLAAGKLEAAARESHAPKRGDHGDIWTAPRTDALRVLADDISDLD